MSLTPHLSVTGRPTDASADLYPTGAAALAFYFTDQSTRKTIRTWLDLSPDLVAFVRRRLTVAGSPASERDQHVAIMRGNVERTEAAGADCATWSTADVRKLVDGAAALIAELAETVAIADEADETRRRWEETVRGLTRELDETAEARGRLVAELSHAGSSAARSDELARRRGNCLAEMAVTVEQALAEGKLDELLAARLLALADPVRLGAAAAAPVTPLVPVDAETTLAEVVDQDSIEATQQIGPVRLHPFNPRTIARVQLTDRQLVGADCVMCARMGDEPGVVLASTELPFGRLNGPRARVCGNGTGCDVPVDAEIGGVR